jgi:hypothetical protein
VVNLAVDLNGQPPMQVFIRLSDRPVIVLTSIDSGFSQEITTYEDLDQASVLGSPFPSPGPPLPWPGSTPGSTRGTTPPFGISSRISAEAPSCLFWRRFPKGPVWEPARSPPPPSWGRCPTSVGWAGPGKTAVTEPNTRDLGLLYYTGITRVAKSILSEIVARRFLNENAKLSGVDEIKTHGLVAFEALQRCDLEETGRALARSWELNKVLDSGTSVPEIDAVVSRVRDLCWGLPSAVRQGPGGNPADPASPRGQSAQSPGAVRQDEPVHHRIPAVPVLTPFQSLKGWGRISPRVVVIFTPSGFAR